MIHKLHLMRISCYYLLIIIIVHKINSKHKMRNDRMKYDPPLSLHTTSQVCSLQILKSKQSNRVKIQMRRIKKIQDI